VLDEKKARKNKIMYGYQDMMGWGGGIGMIAF
jgi:hypothetical protein